MMIITFLIYAGVWVEMVDNLHNVKIFIASPSDVRKEREKVHEIAQKINESVAGPLDFHLEVVGWEQVIPDLGDRPQEIINQQIGPYDIFIGIMWKRFGTPSGKADSGTEEELDITMECKEKCGKPRIMFYFNQEPYTLQNEGEIEQVGKVIKFRDKLREKGLVWDYKGCDNFAEIIDIQLSKLIVKWGTESKEELKGANLEPYFAHTYPLQKNFTGRLKEREMLTEWLEEDPNPVLAVIAFGGMGKSALSWYWLHEDLLMQGKVFNGVIWWSFYDRESSFDSFLNHSISYVYKNEVDPKGIRSTRDKMDKLFEGLRDRNFLIVLDGLERILRAYAGLGSPYQSNTVKEDERQEFRTCIDPNAGIFLQMLSAGYPKTKTLITSRLFPKELDGLAGCRRIDLKRMDKEDAVDFFNAQGVIGTRAEIEACCEPYGYHPLFLRLLSGMITEDPENPGEIDQAKHCKIKDAASKEHFVLKTAYEALSPEKQVFISKLAAFRTPMEYNAIVIFNTFGDKKELNAVLKELVNRGILFFDKDKIKYDLHPIVRSYCYDRLRAKEGVHSQLRDYFASVPEPEKIESIDDLEPVIELYHHTVGAGKPERARELYVERIQYPIYFQFGAYQTQIELLKALFPEGEEKLPNLKRKDQKAGVLNELANAYSLSGQPRRAVPLFQKHIEVSQKIEDKTFEAVGLGNLAGMTQIPIGDLESAESNLRRAIEIDCEKHIEFREGEHRCYIGPALLYIAKFEESGIELIDAQKIVDERFKTVAPNNLISVVRAYRALRALLMDNPDEALRFADQALELAKKTSKEWQPFTRDFIVANWLIGASHVALKEIKKAEGPLQFAITECRKINMVDHEALILLEIAKLAHLRKNDAEAKKIATEALEIANRCGYVFQQADIYLFLSEFYKDQGNISKAKEHAKLAKLRSHQMINVETGDYIEKPEDTKWKYKPCYDKAKKLLEELESIKE
jgi:tetratricopeptide (TPR) repeat protein